MSGVAIRLTSLAHGGGCGCKLAPAVLQELLADQPVAPAFYGAQVACPASIVGRAESGKPGIRVTGALASARR